MNLDYQLLEACLRDPRNQVLKEGYKKQQELDTSFKILEAGLLGGTPLWHTPLKDTDVFPADEFLLGMKTFTGKDHRGNAVFRREATEQKLRGEDLPALLHWMKDDAAADAEIALWHTASTFTAENPYSGDATTIRVCPPIPRHYGKNSAPPQEPRIPNGGMYYHFIDPERQQTLVRDATQVTTRFPILHAYASMSDENRQTAIRSLRTKVSADLREAKMKDMSSVASYLLMYDMYTMDGVNLVKSVVDEQQLVPCAAYLVFTDSPEYGVKNAYSRLSVDTSVNTLAEITGKLYVNVLRDVAKRSSSVRANLLKYLLKVPYKVLKDAEAEDPDYKSKLRPLLVDSMSNPLFSKCFENHDDRRQTAYSRANMAVLPDVPLERMYSNWIEWAEPFVRIRRKYQAAHKRLKEIADKYQAPDFFRDFLVLWSLRQPKTFISPAVELWAERQPALPDDVLNVIEHLQSLELERRKA